MKEAASQRMTSRCSTRRGLRSRISASSLESSTPGAPAPATHQRSNFDAPALDAPDAVAALDGVERVGDGAVVAAAAVDRVSLAVGRLHLVAATAASDRVLAGVAVQVVAAPAAVDDVVGIAAPEAVAAGSPEQAVAAAEALELVAAALAADAVGPRRAVDHVTLPGALEEVLAGLAGRVGPGVRVEARVLDQKLGVAVVGCALAAAEAALRVVGGERAPDRSEVLLGHRRRLRARGRCGRLRRVIDDRAEQGQRPVLVVEQLQQAGLLGPVGLRSEEHTS